MLLTFSAPTNSSLDSPPPHPLPPLLPLYNMSMSIDQLSQNPSQTWIWQSTMDNPQHYYYHNQVEHHQQQQQHEVNYDGKEHMFEKPLTPSDVGKLNRLVIPKQHAERYFPIDNESGEKGLLLSFEDEGGKTWKFRYSYWTSSQSYVLTKGWSRFVKEKRLDAGDVVHFERYRPGSNDYRLFIGCRRRGGGGGGSSNETPPTTTTATTSTSTNAALPWSPPYGSNPYPSPYYYMNSVSSGERGSGEGIAAAASPVVSSTRRLRLFGVNLECGPEPPQHLVSSSSSWSQFTNNA